MWSGIHLIALLPQEQIEIVILFMKFRICHDGISLPVTRLDSLLILLHKSRNLQLTLLQKFVPTHTSVIRLDQRLHRLERRPGLFSFEGMTEVSL